MSSPTVDLAKQLIRIPSITPNDGGCMEILLPRLEKLGFKIEKFPCEDVTNIWARLGNEPPLLCFAGHTDVVPTGPIEQWKFEPFEPTVHDGYLYGRGSADMKSAVAAFIVALEMYLQEHKPNGSIALLITSAEEALSWKGTKVVVEQLQKRGEQIDYCIVGEASSTTVLGDVIKNGRRGSLNGALTIKGIQGHIAYPQLADNPIHSCLTALRELAETEFDKGNEYFSPSSFQFSNINAGTGAENVIPASLEAKFNIRYCPEVTEEMLKERIAKILQKHNVNYKLRWTDSSKPFFCQPGVLAAACQKSIKQISGVESKLATTGGTSDGRYIAPAGAEVVELGVTNATIHKINECAKVEDINNLTLMYRLILIEVMG